MENEYGEEFVNSSVELINEEENKWQKEKQNIHKEIIEHLKQLLATMPGHEKVSEERKMRQQAILDRLPDDLWLNYKAHTVNYDYHQAIYNKKIIPASKWQNNVDVPKTDVITPFDNTTHSITVGNVFEELVRVDPNICPNPETALAKLVRTYMEEPDRFTLPESLKPHHRLRNPDLAIVNEKGEIKGWVECKAGKLDVRAIDQIRMFKKSFEDALLELKKMARDFPDLLEQHGLGLIIKEQDKLRLSDILDLRLAIPYTDYNGDPTSLLADSVPEHEKQSVLFALKDVYKVTESPFDRYELNAINDYLLDKLKRERQQADAQMLE